MESLWKYRPDIELTKEENQILPATFFYNIFSEMALSLDRDPISLAVEQISGPELALLFLQGRAAAIQVERGLNIEQSHDEAHAEIMNIVGQKCHGPHMIEEHNRLSQIWDSYKIAA
jgi:hypothetical protein